MDRTGSGGHNVEKRGQGTVEGEGASSSEAGVEQGLGARGGGARQGVRSRLSKAGDLGEGEHWLPLAMFGHTSITLY
jgi:hypothetical protein